MKSSSLKWIILSLFLALLLVIVGCSSDTAQDDSDRNQKEETTEDSKQEESESSDDEPASGGQLRIAYSAQPPSLDLHVSTAAATTEIIGPVFEQLITVDSNYEIKPMLAESYEVSDDGLTITFHLRQGVLFHNGKEMKAEDVVASMNRWKDLPGGRGQFGDSEFVEIDDYTVEFRMPRPLSTALSALSQAGTTFSGIMPKEVVESASVEGVNEIIGTGPFKFVEWVQDQYVHLQKFDDYQSRTEESDGHFGAKEALLDDIYFEFVLDPSTRAAGLQTGEYDIAQSMPIDNALLLEQDPDITLHTVPSVSTLVLIPNKAKGFFTDVKAREVLAAVLDADEIMQAAFSDERFYRLDSSMMLEPQQVYWYSDQGKEKYNQKNPEKAKQLLEEIGYNGEPIRIITDRDYASHYNASVVFQKQLEEIGMNVQLEVYDWPTQLEKIDDPDAYDLYIMGHSLRADPTAIYYFAKGEGGFTDSEELDQLLEEFRSQPSLEDTKDVFDRLQKWHWEYIPAIKIGEYSRADMARNTVENLRHQGRMLLWNVTNNK